MDDEDPTRSLNAQADAHYCSRSEYVRQLIVADMQAKRGGS